MKLGLSSIGFGAGIGGEKGKGVNEEEEKKLNSKTNEAILRKTVRVIMRCFKVDMNVEQSVLDDALDIHKAEADSPYSLLRCIESFQSKYDRTLYTGFWVAGGSLVITATTTSIKKTTYGDFN